MIAPATDRRVFSVSRVVQRADEVLREKARPLWVRGEISGWRKYPSGYCFFTLKDSQAELCCTLSAHAARKLPMDPADGTEVDVFGQLGLYVKKGEFRLEAFQVESTGAGGLWQLAREKLLAQLRSEGLLDEARKRTLPPYPERIGIATSGQSAALHDMQRTLRRKAWWVTTVVSHCSVEGPDSGADIACAIRRLTGSRRAGGVEVVIVARGGGSMESLWGFNTEPVARAIAECPVPVISAVGHETDYTVADFVADHRAATPTAGAEHAVPDGREILSYLGDYPRAARLGLDRSLREMDGLLGRSRGELERTLLRRLDVLGTALAGTQRHLEARSPRTALERSAADLERLGSEIRERMERRLRERGEELTAAEELLHGAARTRLDDLEWTLARLADQLDNRSPLKVLSRGYAMVSDERGRVVRSADQVSAGDRLRVRLAEGTLDVRAEPAATPDLQTEPDR